MPATLTRPTDGLVRALPRSLQLRAAEPVDPEEAGESAAEEAAENAMPTLCGIFTRFDEATQINSYYEGNFIERIARGAFARWFADELDSIRCLFQHGMDFQVGDKPLGPIARCAEGAEGPEYEVPLLDAHYVREIIPGLEAGLYGASFRFRVMREEWVEEPGPSDGNPQGLPERTILEAQVPEFGPVTFPAYPGATAGLRSITDDYLARRFLQSDEGLEETLEAAANPEALSELFASRGVRSAARMLPARTEAPAPAETPAAETPAEGEPAGEPPAESETTETPAAAAAEPVSPEAPESAEEAPETAGREAAETAETPGAEPEVEGEQDAAPTPGSDNQPRGGAATPNQATRGAADTEENNMNLAQLEARQEEIRSRLTEIHEAHTDAELPAELQTEFDELESERAANETKLASIRARQENVRALARSTENREAGAGDATLRGGAPSTTSDPYDVGEIMSRARSASSDSARGSIMRDAALRAIDSEDLLFHERVNPEQAKSHIDNLLRREARIVGSVAGARSEIAERILNTGSELYQRSFIKVVSGAALSPEEQRALATFTGASGGFAVPYQLDPTLIPTSNSSVNPFRAIARSVTTMSNEWKGVTSGAITAAYAAEGTEASDNTPTLAQPVANPERCQAFVPFSYEVEGDWTEALTEMAMLISEAKDDLEAIKFLEGAGHGSNEPEGLLTGATTVVKAGGTAAFAVKDLYALEAALPARFRSKAQFMANRAIYNLIRQFDTAGGAALWVWLREGLGNNGPTPGNIEAKLAGYPVNEETSMKEVLTTGTKILTIGDFSKFLIVDRVGMDIQVIPNLFGASGRPTGQRGLYAFWRNTSKVLAKAAFRTLETS